MAVSFVGYTCMHKGMSNLSCPEDLAIVIPDDIVSFWLVGLSLPSQSDVLQNCSV